MRPIPAFLAAASLLLATPSVAQSVMAPGAMPPPPSASDAPPRKESEAAAKKRAAARKAQAAGDGDGSSRTTRSSGTQASGYRERIDTRPSGPIQLEDDPRAVQPMMQNGRPGMGMRF